MIPVPPGSNRRWEPFLVLPGLLFSGLVRLRNALYDGSLLPAKHLPHPVLSIGNLTVGGSGKTPLVIYVADLILGMGATPVLLSRGYGRSLRSHVIAAPEDKIPTPVELLGDEPALIRARVPGLWLGIAGDRYSVAARAAGRISNPCFVLDDGFQHRSLARDLDIVIIDRTQPLSRNRMLPLGTLREPVGGVRRAGMVVIHGPSAVEECDLIDEEVRRIHPRAELFHCLQKIERLVPFDEWRRHGARGEGDKLPVTAFLVAAIGNPERFRRDVASLKIGVAGARFLRDHNRLTAEDWKSCARQAASLGASTLITTEKDAIKVANRPDFRLLVAVQTTDVTERMQFAKKLSDMIRGHS